MNLYTGKADWTWVEPHLGGKWRKTGQRQGEEILSGALLFKPRRQTHACVYTHTHPYTRTCLWLLADHFSWLWPLPKQKSSLTAPTLTSKERRLLLPELEADPRWRIKLLTSGCSEQTSAHKYEERMKTTKSTCRVGRGHLHIVLYPASSRKNALLGFHISSFLNGTWHSRVNWNIPSSVRPSPSLSGTQEQCSIHLSRVFFH